MDATPRTSSGNSTDESTQLQSQHMNHHYVNVDAGKFNRTAEQSYTLPASWYTDPDIFELEKERIFYRHCAVAGAAADGERPGSYITVEVVDQAIFVIRGADGALRGFYNVCSHRAHRLINGAGEKDVIACPYHGWTYENNGCFKGARGVDTLDGFDCQAANLKPVRVDILSGLVFVNLDLKAQPIAALCESMTADMERHCPGLGRLVLAHRHEVETAANWKTLVDNNLESYPVAVAHPRLVDLLDYKSFAVWESDLTTSHAMTNSNPDNAAYRVGTNDPVKRALYTWLWPNTAFFIAPGHNNLAIFQMIPTGAETSLQRWDFYFEDSSPIESERAYLDYTIETLIPEDSRLYESVQLGFHSRGYTQGRLVVNRDVPEWSEHHTHMFQKLVYESLNGANL